MFQNIVKLYHVGCRVLSQSRSTVSLKLSRKNIDDFIDNISVKNCKKNKKTCSKNIGKQIQGLSFEGSGIVTMDY